MNKKIRLFELTFIIYALWYYLPISKALFSSNINIVFFMFYIMSMGLVVLYSLSINTNHLTPGRKCGKGILMPIVAYMAIFFVFYKFGWKQADKHIRVSFTFWGTYLFYYLSGNFTYSRNRIGKVLIFAFVATYISTFMGVITDISVVRALSDAGADDMIQKGYLLRNISSIYFIQTTVLVVPLAMYYAFYKKNCKIIVRLLSMMFIGVELYFLILASLTISILLYVVAVVLSILCYSDEHIKGAKFIIFAVFICCLFLIDFEGICNWISDNVNNKYLQERFSSLADMFGGKEASGDVGLRLDLYTSSLITFFKNPFGIGPNYTYIPFSEGIGHHSQMLDDFARYGILAVIFYISYLKSFYQLLCDKYDKIGLRKIVIPIFILYIGMLILNLSFRSPYESIFILYIIFSFADNLYEKQLKTEGVKYD